MSTVIPGFHFRVDFCVAGKYIKDVSFLSVSGLKFTWTSKDSKIGAAAGGDTISQFDGVKFEDLVLERGMTKESNLIEWISGQCTSGKKDPIPVVVTALNEKHLPLFSWFFINAYPVSWENSGFNAEKSQILMEKITLKYDYFKQVDMSSSTSIADIKTNSLAIAS